jgi:hypothetical protein
MLVGLLGVCPLEVIRSLRHDLCKQSTVHRLVAGEAAVPVEQVALTILLLLVRTYSRNVSHHLSCTAQMLALSHAVWHE